MLNDFLIWIGWSSENVWTPALASAEFWTSPLALTCTFLLTLTSVIRVTHWKTNPSAFDTFWHFAMSLTTGAAFMVGVNHGNPQHVVKTLIILMTIRGIYKCIGIFRNDSRKIKSTNR